MRFGGTWDSFPSDDSLSLSLTDPVVHNLRSKAISREIGTTKNRIEWVKARRTQQAQALARRKAERESLLLDYKMHSERLKFKERARQRSISAGEGVDLFGMSEADELVLKDSEREVGAEEIDASVTEAGA